MPSNAARTSPPPAVAARLLMACQHRRFAAVNALDALRQAAVVNADLLDRSFASALRLAAANRVVARYWERNPPAGRALSASKPRGRKA